MKTTAAWIVFALMCAMLGGAVVFYVMSAEQVSHWTAAVLAGTCLFLTAVRPLSSRQDERIGRVQAITEAMTIVGDAADRLEEPADRLQLRLLALEIGALTDKEPPS